MQGGDVEAVNLRGTYKQTSEEGVGEPIQVVSWLCLKKKTQVAIGIIKYKHNWSKNYFQYSP